jgi:hypothetical protein
MHNGLKRLAQTFLTSSNDLIPSQRGWYSLRMYFSQLLALHQHKENAFRIKINAWSAHTHCPNGS